MAEPTTSVPDQKLSPAGLFAECFRLGLVAFGGPAAHVGMLDQVFVERRKLLDREAFLELVSAANLIPGPNSTETVMHLGYRLGGWRGLFAAGAGFILPAASLTLLVAWAYTAGRDLAFAEPLLLGIQAGVLGLIAQALWKLLGKAAPDMRRRTVAALAMLLAGFGAPEALVILGLGLLWMLLNSQGGPLQARTLQGWVLLILAWFPAAANPSDSTAARLAPTSLIPSSMAPPGFWALTLVFLKTGAVLFGSGYVLVAYLEGDLVDRLGWMTQAELLDAIAMGQFTPGPVLTTATFVGYQLLGGWGALLATLGIFAPSFLFVALTAPMLDRLRQWAWAKRFLQGANAAAVGVMGAVLVRLFWGLPGILPKLLALASVGLMFAVPAIGPVRLVVGAAVLGGVLHLLGLL